MLQIMSSQPEEKRTFTAENHLGEKASFTIMQLGREDANVPMKKWQEENGKKY
ncbi:Uncharacterised protein [uncultured archaeon]|nr:Uncharacterised protein [uncultured archaeon]